MEAEGRGEQGRAGEAPVVLCHDGGQFGKYCSVFTASYKGTVLTLISAPSSCGKLFVLGGDCSIFHMLAGTSCGVAATDVVWSYDPILRLWDRRASMLVPRVNFACCVLEGKIIVAGGFNNLRQPTSKAEIYDPEKDVWVQLPDLPYTHHSGCSGVVVGDKFHVLHKGCSKVLVLENPCREWAIKDYGWLDSPMAMSVVGGELYVLNKRVIFKQNKEGRLQKVAAAVQHHLMPSTIMVDWGLR
ncbi:F-box/kelch-repeat protein SKIP30-like [Macadamia integrifolia]|uniref:F-box/kelch-repeat protein SKIP30-like n=1 Tax=Macadamia integrifolia TaxID=60698 RepID=UPI001C4F460B|nr:F-box/kelch-repeat protein SKIP30-like [Macadamia integrifolia]